MRIRLIYFFFYIICQSFDNTSCIFGRAWGHRPYTLLTFELAVASYTPLVAKLASYTFPFGVQR